MQRARAAEMPDRQPRDWSSLADQRCTFVDQALEQLINRKAQSIGFVRKARFRLPRDFDTHISPRSSLNYHAEVGLAPGFCFGRYSIGDRSTSGAIWPWK